ncbi:autophagocytosis associated protein [Jimgerdemannia flammicorona]|uniref:Autophagy-related protein 3 n=1 Tax=Jimgerdemannia flammicorona TaxID=994334 RepID=A0A433DCJ1_9FUNG|nr:autophagocytosis associated protein [Jimgerdemannia flammicorona]
MQNVYNSVFSTFHSVREYLAPVLKNSKFRETGCVTPEEFVAAGDFLVYKCPTWSWEGGEPSKHRDYLPADKQFLITRNGILIDFVSLFVIFARIPLSPSAG